MEFRFKIIWKNLCFTEAILVSFLMLKNEKRHFVIRNALNSRWLGFRHNNDLGMKLSVVGQCLMFVFECVLRCSTGGGGGVCLPTSSEPFSLFYHSI